MGGSGRLCGMSRHEFVTVSLRLLGLVLVAVAARGVAEQATAFVQTLAWLDWHLSWLWSNFDPANDNYGLSRLEVAVLAVQFALGTYLLLGGRRLGRWIARLERDRCVGCGYDLTGVASGQRCPECGTERE